MPKSKKINKESKASMTRALGLKQSGIYESTKASESGSLPSIPGLIRFLRDEKILTPDQLDIAFREQTQTGRAFPVILVELGFLTEKTLAEIQAQAHGLKFVSLKSLVLDAELIQHLPLSIAKQTQALLVDITPQTAQVVMSDGGDLLAHDALRQYFAPRELLPPLVAPRSEILEALTVYDDLEASPEHLFRVMEKDVENQDPLSSDTLYGLQSPVIRLVNALLLNAVGQDASDIHFEPEEAFVRIRYRIDGVMHPVRSFHKDHWPMLCARLKILGSLNIAETRKPQNGRFSMYVRGREIDFRLAAHPTVFGENMVVRILDKTRSLLPLKDLGFLDVQVMHLHTLINRPHGIFIVTGPTGSGKTTTLYSLLMELSQSDLNIMTLEEPVEYRLPLVRQTEIKEGGLMNFADGIRSILRQDPDIILVGEIRDEETAQMALRASMTGHRVLTTLHTNDALGVIQRLEDLGVSRSFLSDNLIGVLGQRLVRKLCPKCKNQAFPHTACIDCHEGYSGRIVLGELLENTPEFSQALAKGAALSELQEILRAQNFVSFTIAGSKLIEEGMTDKSEINRVLGGLL